MKHETVRASQLNGCAFCVHMHVKEATLHGECALPLMTRALPECPLKDAAGSTDQTTPYGYGFAKAMSGGNGSVCKEVWFKHLPTASLSAYRQLFGVTPKFGMPRVGFVFSARDLDRPNQTRSDVLSDISLHFLQTRQGSRAASTTFDVRRIISRMIGSEPVNQADVAAELCITVRTLQRRLRAENTCFDAILDDIRRGLTSDYLRQTTLSLSQVAERLQFNDTSAFTRACHRWFGSSPKSVRQVFLAEDTQRRREVHGSLVGALADNLNPVVS
ncbi:helix-turn-helix domain-containing protein [Bradyrhizobium yuanmingense]|uniref:AraC family transcriptional regulator n=1 Tax=Bradyrhizobium yuanmingense TaxID=108015 RepID=UPI0023B8ED62|nr:helix-turn-helix domain-containing protein [Bradyrhizobium yuanmingense]MDF0519300.1 helix-turn-helix domain-containing protein [Bradyrhizobium yuanmingense]